MRQPCMYSLLYFNPRSREGATCRFCYANKTIVISIHAPAKERPSSQNMRRLRSDFNPRSREGATQSDNRGVRPECISIHAPAKERQQM